MTRYQQIAWARDGVGSGAITPTGDWAIGEVDTAIRSALGAGRVGLTSSEISLVLAIAYSYGSAGAEGHFVNVANQHVTAFYTLPRDPFFGFSVNYDGYVSAQSTNMHIFTANAPTDNAVRLGIMLLGSSSTDPPDTPADSEVVPGVAPTGTGFSASVWITIPAGESDLGLVAAGTGPVSTLALPDIENLIAVTGNAYSQVLPEATGGVPPYTYTLAGLPTDYAFTAATRTISSTTSPAITSPVELTYGVVDSATPSPASASKTFTIHTAGTMSLGAIFDLMIQEGETGTVALLAADGGSPPITYRLTPSLPSFAQFRRNPLATDGSGSVLAEPMSGDAGDYGPFTWMATDSQGSTSSEDFEINITATETLALGAIADVDVVKGDDLSVTLSAATGGFKPYTYSLEGYPPWSIMNPGNSTLTGTVETTGMWTLTWKVIDNQEQEAEVSFTITATAELSDLLTLPAVPNYTWAPGVAASAILTEASGGTGPYTYTLQLSDDEGSMNMPIPAWLSFTQASRSMSASSPVLGLYYMVYSVTDSSTPQRGATREFLLTVTSESDDWASFDAAELDDGVYVIHYGDSVSNNPTRIGFVMDVPPLEMFRGRAPDTNEFITPTAEWTCHIPEDEIDTALGRYNTGDIIRVVIVESGVINVRHTGKLRSLSVVRIDGAPAIRGSSIGLTAGMRDAYPFEFDLWNTDVRNAAIASIRASGFVDTDYTVATANLHNRLAWFGIREDQGINLLQVLRFLTERTEGGNASVDEMRTGVLRVSGNTTPTATTYAIPTVAQVRQRKRVIEEVAGISYDTWEWTAFDSGTIFYDYTVTSDVPEDDIRRLYKIPRPSPMGPYQQLPFQFEIELPEHLYIQDISSATTFPLTNITAINVIRSRWDKVLIYGLGAPPGELTRIILRGSGAIARPRETKYYPASVGYPGPRPRDFGVIKALGNYPTVSETDALAAALALYDKRKKGAQVFDVLIDPADDAALNLDAGSPVSFMWEGSQRSGTVRGMTERRQGLRWQVRLVVDGER